MNLYYIQVNLLCLILLIGVRYIMSGKRDFLPAKALAFNRLVSICMFLCVSDMFSWIVNGKIFSGSGAVLELANMIYYLTITWSGFAWLVYVRVSLLSLSYDHKKWMKYSAIPLLIMTLVIIINPLTHFLYSIDENVNYTRGNGVIMHWIVSWGYLLAATGQTFRQLRKAKTKAERDQILPMLWFIVMPVIAAVIQMFFYGITTMQCGITLSTLMIAASTVREQIATDPLTGLNNRRSLDNYVADRLEKADRMYSIMLIDIDKFKTINDTLGHTMGDIALQRVAQVLKESCARSGMPMFLCRYGGDEFVMCGTDLAAGALNKMIGILNERLEAYNSTVPEKQQVTLSYGLAEGRCTEEKQIIRLIQTADHGMYEMKKAKDMDRE